MKSKVKFFVLGLLVVSVFFILAKALYQKSDKVRVDLFFNSFDRGFFQSFIVLDTIRHRIGADMDLKITCLNTSSDECKRLALLNDFYPDKVYDYLSASIMDSSPDGWVEALMFAGVEPSELEKRLKSSRIKKSLAKQSDYAKSKNVSYFIVLVNDVPYFGPISLLPMLEEINFALAENKKIHIPSAIVLPKTKTKVYVIESKDLFGKEDKNFTQDLKNMLGQSLVIEKISYEKAKKMYKFKKLGIDFLPFYAIEKNENTTKLLGNALKAGIAREEKKFLTVASGGGFSTGVFVNVKPEDKKLVLFTMTQCPYGTQAENALINAMDLGILPEGMKIDIKYIVDVKTSKKGKKIFSSLHGTSEWEEAVRQILIKKYYPYNFWKYLSLRNEDPTSSRWIPSAAKFGIDVNLIEKNFEAGKSLLEKDASLTNKLKINSSPTFLWQGRKMAVGLVNLTKIKEFEKINAGKVEGKCN